MRSSVWAVLFLAVLYPLSLFASEPKYDINVNVFLTPDGKKVEPPSKASPAYYYPIVAGYTEIGPVVAGEKVPEKKEVLHMMAKALANQGYLVARPGKTPAASLLLVCRWGYMNPDITVTDSDTGDPSDPVSNTNFNNQDKLMALVSGLSANLVDPKGRVGMMNQQDEASKNDALDDRYFVIVTAYEMAALCGSSGEENALAGENEHAFGPGGIARCRDADAHYHGGSVFRPADHAAASGGGPGCARRQSGCRDRDGGAGRTEGRVGGKSPEAYQFNRRSPRNTRNARKERIPEESNRFVPSLTGDLVWDRKFFPLYFHFCTTVLANR